MTRRKRRIEEGAWFAVPIAHRFVPGVVARRGRGGVLLIYFFGRVFDRLPGVAALSDLVPEDAIHISLVGDLRLRNGTWPIVGRNESWRREDWKAPPFVRESLLGGPRRIVRYRDEDVSEVESEVATLGTGDVARMPRDGLLGALAAEIVLANTLGLPRPAAG
jgi:hypothetical protein